VHGAHATNGDGESAVSPSSVTRTTGQRGSALGDAADGDLDRQFAAALELRDLRAVFQPVFDLRSGEIVALEALARGPQSTPLVSPRELFDAARRAGRVAELDWACRATAFATFLEAGVPPSVSLFVNVEPEAIATTCPADLAPVIAKAESHLRVFVEINDRALITDPAGVLASTDRAREMGWGITVDNVGSSPSPVAMLPIVSPDVVKLDLRRLTGTSHEASSAIITSVLRHTEKTGAALLVEGIETAQDARWALALGATYGQGHHLGLPGPLLAHYPTPRAPIPLIKVAPTDVHVASPFELFEYGPLVKSTRSDLDDLTALLADSPRTSGCPSVFLSCVGPGSQVPTALLALGIPERAMFFVAFGTDMPAEPTPGARGVRLPPGDAFAREEFLIVLGSQAPVAIFARASSSEFYEAAVTQDFELVHEIARHVIRRVPRFGRDNRALGAAAEDDSPANEGQSPGHEEHVGALGGRLGWRGWRSPQS
jgi:EAL domain-containing protein (putative c-di-GMP-specific phosphodiesterase class I)